MKITKHFIIVIFAACFITSCENENVNNSQSNFYGKLVKHSECKQENIVLQDDVPENVSQINYSFDAATNKLTLKHINVEFNCCIDSLYSDISLVNDTILIKEFEFVTNPCRCKCLYDLEMLVTGVEAKKYTVKITEPYNIVFDIDLKTTTTGSFNIIMF